MFRIKGFPAFFCSKTWINLELFTLTSIFSFYALIYPVSSRIRLQFYQMSIRSTEIHKNRDFGIFHCLGKKPENTSPEIHNVHIPCSGTCCRTPQTTAHPFQLPQDLSVRCMSANVLLSFEQLLFPQVCTGSLTLYDCNKAKYFSEKAASYIKTRTPRALS